MNLFLERRVRQKRQELNNNSTVSSPPIFPSPHPTRQIDEIISLLFMLPPVMRRSLGALNRAECERADIPVFDSGFLLIVAVTIVFGVHNIGL